MSVEDLNTDETRPAYVRLALKRAAARSDLPEDLNQFYAAHEGMGLQPQPGCVLQLAKYDEVGVVGWEDLGVPEGLPDPRWKDFRAIRIGHDNSWDTIYYVRWAPGASAGSILAFGDIADGPAGQDRGGTVGALVLAASFHDWINRMARHGPDASGLFFPIELPESAQDEIVAELAALNPYSRYGRLRGSAAE